MTAADHANTVRDGLQCYMDDVCPSPEFMEARGNAWFAALDALQAQAETAEKLSAGEDAPDVGTVVVSGHYVRPTDAEVERDRP